jgi:hypothetical protein
MTAAMVSPLSHRDRAVLRAVDAGRCVLAGVHGLIVDGLCCSDQFAGSRLTAAGLITASGASGLAQLTAAGRAALGIG